MKTKIQQRGCLVMMTTLRPLPAVALGLLLLLGVPGLARAQYVFTPIDVPGATATYADGNSAHEIVGEYIDEDGNTHGFVLNKGDLLPHIDPFDVPDADGYTSINGINARGDRAGIYFASDRYFGYFLARRETSPRSTHPARASRGLLPQRARPSRGVLRGCRDENPSRLRLEQGRLHLPLHRRARRRTGRDPAVGINEPGQIVGAYGDADNHRSTGSC